MAIYHFTQTVPGRAKGCNALAGVAYRAGIAVEDELTGHKFNRTDKSEVVFSEIIAPQNSQKWVYNPEQLFNKVERAEVRKDAQLGIEQEFALPCELTLQQHIKLIKNYIKSLQNEHLLHSHVFQYSVHNKNDGNPHVHLWISQRPLVNNLFSKKRTDLAKPAFLCGGTIKQENGTFLQKKGARELCAISINTALKEANKHTQISHLSLSNQGINRPMPLHKGRKHKQTPHRNRQSRIDRIANRLDKDICKMRATVCAIKHEIENTRCDIDEFGILKFEPKSRAIFEVENNKKFRI